MNKQKLSRLASNKKIQSSIPKIQITDSKTQLSKDKHHDQISNIHKYTYQHDKDKNYFDQTDRFLADTKKRLYSSTQTLRNFHLKKQTYNLVDQTIDFQVLSKELKKSNKKPYYKKYSQLGSRSYKINQFQERNDQQKKIQFEMDTKLTLIQKIISPDDAIKFREQLTNKVSQMKKQYDQKDPMRKKMITYYINHQIISKFLQETAKDTRKITLKQHNISLYHKMKNQMVSLLSNQEHFHKHIMILQKLQSNRANSFQNYHLFQEQKFIKNHSKPKYGSASQKIFLQKIQNLLELSKNNIKEAFNKFGQPSKSQQIQQKFNKSLQNNFIQV